MTTATGTPATRHRRRKSWESIFEPSNSRGGLRDETDRPRRRCAVRILPESRDDALKCVNESQAVRSAQTHPGCARDCGDLRFERAPVLAEFGETGTEDDDRFDTAGAKLAQYCSHGLCGDRHDRKVDRSRDVCDGGVTNDAADDGILRIHRVELAAIAFVEEMLERPAVDSREIGRRADDGDGRGTQQRMQVVHQNGYSG